MIINQIGGGREEDDKGRNYLNIQYNLKLQTDVWHLGITLWDEDWNLAFVATVNYNILEKIYSGTAEISYVLSTEY